MRFVLNLFRSRRASPAEPTTTSPRLGGDDTLGRGMDLALTVLAFLIIGWLLDQWLGVFPVLTIGLVVFAAVGSFIRMKYTYDLRMEQLEQERLERAGARGRAAEDAA